MVLESLLAGSCRVATGCTATCHRGRWAARGTGLGTSTTTSSTSPAHPRTGPRLTTPDRRGSRRLLLLVLELVGLGDLLVGFVIEVDLGVGCGVMAGMRSLRKVAVEHDAVVPASSYRTTAVTSSKTPSPSRTAAMIRRSTTTF